MTHVDHPHLSPSRWSRPNAARTRPSSTRKRAARADCSIDARPCMRSSSTATEFAEAALEFADHLRATPAQRPRAARPMIAPVALLGLTPRREPAASTATRWDAPLRAGVHPPLPVRDRRRASGRDAAGGAASTPPGAASPSTTGEPLFEARRQADADAAAAGVEFLRALRGRGSSARALFCDRAWCELDAAARRCRPTRRCPTAQTLTVEGFFCDRRGEAARAARRDGARAAPQRLLELMQAHLLSMRNIRARSSSARLQRSRPSA